ncbi:ABC transporter ATP-binding protein/permease [Bartonella sp. HY329]|uniref:ATP-binding cassette domain-containing protein n=1 Tax=unclassified Bartonella TaxID=2645622 RepID=UPI0021C8AE0C|nr:MULTISPECIES: ABC transporter ATP-binding protein [unclassified Bartonella]UXM96113.1 ABC transporter ATP-binding protein/permease [Bartonella sp. HY329]UXN10437.1 ABC transporter ATP-binding protein/permease [Bartonella sp. HY328]
MHRHKSLVHLLIKSFGRKGLRYLTIILIISIFIALLSSYAPILLATIIKNLQNIKSDSNSSFIIAQIIAFVTIIGLARLMSPFITYLNAKIRAENYGFVTDTYFDHYNKNSDDQSLYKTPARVASHINQVNNEIYIIYNHLTSQILIPFCQLIISSVILFFLQQYIFLFVIYIYLIAYMLIQIYFSRIVVRYKLKLMESGRSVYDLLEDFLNNINVAVRFNTFKILSHSFKAKLADDLTVQKPYFRCYIGLSFINYLLVFLFGNIVLIYSYGKVVYGPQGIEYFIMMNGYLMMLIMPIEQIGGVYTALRQSFSALFHFMDEVDFNECHLQKSVQLKTIENIRFVNFSYAHNGSENIIFKNMSLDINKGDKIALIGQSGIGKSTFAKILYGLDTKKRGTLFLSDIDAMDLSVLDLRDKICIITQNSYIFNASSYFNLQVAKADATVFEMETAVKMVGLYDELCALPNAMATQLGHNGDILSGGQKQRLAIARLFLRNPDIIILDEVTSGLDLSTEKLVYDQIYKVFADKIIISISHRAQLLDYSDKIYELVDGNFIKH